jgi:hypothetical protein
MSQPFFLTRLYMGKVRRTFEVIDDVDDAARNDLVKHGNSYDRRDMARMGKIQEMRASFANLQS